MILYVRMSIVSVGLHVVGGNFPVMFIHLKCDLLWRYRKPGNMLFQ